MAKRRITAREVLKDLNAGLDDASLMRKYRVSSQGLQSLFNKMVKAGVITRAEIEERAPMTERTVELGLYICPACGHIHNSEFNECGKCGFSAPGYMQEDPDYRRRRPNAVKQTRKSTAARATTKTETEPIPEPRQTSPEPQPSHVPIEKPQETYPAFEKIFKQSRLLAVVAPAAYVLFVVGLFVLWAISPKSSAVTLPQALVAIFVLQLPALVIVLTSIVNLRALAESLKLFAPPPNSSADRTYSNLRE